MKSNYGSRRKFAPNGQRDLLLVSSSCCVQMSYVVPLVLWNLWWHPFPPIFSQIINEQRKKSKKKKSRVTMIVLHLLFLRRLFKRNPLYHSWIPSQVLCPFHSFLHSFSECLPRGYYPQVPLEATLERNAYYIYLLTQIPTDPECTTLVLYPLLPPSAVSTSHNTAHLPRSWRYLGAGNSFCTALGSQGNGRSLRAWPPPTVLWITGNSSSESGRCSKRQCGLNNSPTAAAAGCAWHLESILLLL